MILLSYNHVNQNKHTYKQLLFRYFTPLGAGLSSFVSLAHFPCGSSFLPGGLVTLPFLLGGLVT